ncbi:MAG: hypothetical protein KGO96_13055 [Elusimicrobia bacterium]|nr:hypothetical protein [Elusimicrobiota bacterium]MDE2426822.1 hypothetical protein [Elusimicrobiota bacterium]
MAITHSPFFWFFAAPARRRFFLVRTLEYAILVSMVFTLSVVIVNFDVGMRLALSLMGSGQLVQASSVGISAVNPGALLQDQGGALSSAVAGPYSLDAVAQLREIFDSVMAGILTLLSAWTVVKSRNDGSSLRDRAKMLLKAVRRSPLDARSGSLLLLEVTLAMWGLAAGLGVLLALLVVLPWMQSMAGPTLFEFIFAQVPQAAWELLALVSGLSLAASWRRTQ